MDRTTDLSHYGVKGMKWGVRKARATGDRRGAGGRGSYQIHPDGKIEITRGAEISRVVRNTNGFFGGVGRGWDNGLPVYASFLPNDTAKYEHFFGRSKSLFVKEASTVLKLTPKNKLVAPGPKEASKIFYDLAKNDPEFRAGLENGLTGLARINLKNAIDNPDSQKAYGTYAIALDAGNYTERFQGTNQKYFDAVKRAGYNMLLDPSDASMDFDAPVIILDGKASLELTTQYIVDKHSQEKVRDIVKTIPYEIGNSYLERLGYA